MPADLLIKLPPDGHKLRLTKSNSQALTDQWQLRETPGSSGHPGDDWDNAYETAAKAGAFAEPDFQQPWRDVPAKPPTLAARPGEAGAYNDQDAYFPRGSGFAWHLGSNYTQLDQARQEIAALHDKRSLVRIGIIDVGFDFKHQALPKPPLLRLDLQRNFGGGKLDDASDPYVEGLLHQNQPGHGTGTLSILAGPQLQNMLRPEQNGVVLGGNPFAEIIPCRIGPTVVLAKTSAFVSAVNYLLAPNGDSRLRVDVISMSMGGLASRAWADAVNRAYEAGIVMVTAAGNNFGLPKSIVFPARFQRVIAACGAMADGTPYIAQIGIMSGNFGPDSKMNTALSAYTPNVPWAEVNAENIVDMNGAGTSSATPQIAAAAALWLNKYKSTLSYQEPWQTVEAVRKALFDSARKPAAEHFKHFGNGILQASDALRIAPMSGLTMTPSDKASWEFFQLFERPFGIAPVADLESPMEQMLNLEL
ncbi:MAG TPA: S8/S53 family peptidase, partial [Bryobacteraceae bacterium]